MDIVADPNGHISKLAQTSRIHLEFLSQQSHVDDMDGRSALLC